MDKPLQPSLTFASKARAYQSEALLKGLPGLCCKCYTMLERLARDRRSSLFGLFFTNKEDDSARAFVPDKLFQLKLTFVTMARAHRSKDALLWGSLLASAANVRPSWKGLPKLITLAYLASLSVTRRLNQLKSLSLTSLSSLR